MVARSTSKLESIYTELRQNVLSGKWKVGERIPTESELAQKFGCSLGTVSKAVALLVHEGIVERKTRTGTRILKNVPTQEASSIKLDAYAFIYASAAHEGIKRTVEGFQDAAQEKRRRMISLTTGDNYQEEAKIIGRLSEFDVRGAAIHPVIVTAQDRVRFSQMLLSSKLPVVLVGLNLPGLNCPAVIVDDFDAGYTMTKHLIDCGLRQIGFSTNHSGDLSMRDRYQGYHRALQDAGLPENPDWVMRESSMQPNYEDPLAEPTRLGAQYLEQAKGVEGVVCSHDYWAIGMIRAARAAGLRVPEDLKVTGIDDYALSNTAEISLTTYHVPSELMGRRAFELVDALVRGEENPKLETQIRGQLIARDSTRV